MSSSSYPPRGSSGSSGHSGPKSSGPEELRDPEIINFKAIRNWLRLSIKAIRRRKGLIFAVTAGMVTLAAVALWALPKTYRVQCRLLAQRNQVLAVRADQNAAVTVSPANAAQQIIRRRENIVNLVKQTQLLKSWDASRAPAMQLKDAITKRLGRPPTNDERIEAMADYLEAKLMVWAEGDTVVIQVDWRDPRMAYRLTDAAQRAFLEARHVQEVATIAEQAAILEGHAAEVQTEIDGAVAQIQSVREKKRKEEKDSPSASGGAGGGSSAAPRAPVAYRPRPAGSADAPPVDSAESLAKQRRLAELPLIIETNERTINELEGFRQRRLAELHVKLQEQRAVYTEAHPAVADVEQAIAAASQESPQVTRLRGELKQLRAEYQGLTQTAPKPSTGAGFLGGIGVGSTAARGRLGEVIRIEQESAEERDPEVEYARAKLRFAIQKFERLQEEIHRARIDLDTAQAAFKYRYTVVTPPELPKGPASPKAPLILVMGVVAGVFIGMIAALSLEFRHGTIVESWQVEDALSIPVLAKIRVHALEPRK